MGNINRTNEEISEELSPMYLTLNRHLAETMGEHVYSVQISPDSVWSMAGQDDGSPSYSIDTIGHIDINLSETSAKYLNHLWYSKVDNLLKGVK